MIGVILGGLLFAAGLILVMLRIARNAERAELDPEYAAKPFIRLGTMYSVAIIIAILAVTTRQEPKLVLVGVPWVALLAWYCFRTAKRIRSAKAPGEKPV